MQVTCVWPPAAGQWQPPGLQAPLWVGACAWRGQTLRALAAEPCVLPPNLDDLPLETALAQVLGVLRPLGGLLACDDACALGSAQQASQLHGVRLLRVASPEQVQWWDEALALGQPFYAIRGSTLRADLRFARPSSLLSALSYGLFLSGDGVWPRSFEENRHGVRWQFAEPVQCSVWVSGVLAHQEEGLGGQWQDGRYAGAVRLTFRTDDGRECWTQPRLVAPPGLAAGEGLGCA